MKSWDTGTLGYIGLYERDLRFMTAHTISSRGADGWAGGHEPRPWGRLPSCTERWAGSSVLPDPLICCLSPGDTGILEALLTPVSLNPW